MANIIPEKSLNFKVYLDGADLLGIAEGNFPNGDMMTTEIKGAGIAGTIDAPATGHMGSMTMSLTWRTVTESFAKVLTPEGHALDLYADLENFDAGAGKVKHSEVHAFVKARTKNYDLGKLVVGDAMETTSEHEVYYMKLFIDSKAVLEIDKFNYVYKVNGVDYLSETRRNLGML